MSQSITFFRYDEKSVDAFWRKCLDDNFSISTTQQVDGLNDTIRSIKSGDASNLEGLFYEIDDRVVKHFSHREYNEYTSRINSALSFWIKAQTSKDFESDFAYQAELVEADTWREIFTYPKKLSEIVNLKNQDTSLQEADITPQELLDIYLSIKAVYEYSILTDTEMLALPDDVSLSARWSQRQAELLPKVTQALKNLRPDKMTVPAAPPFAINPVPVKEFFVPVITLNKDGKKLKVVYENTETGEVVETLWASRVLPGDTYQNALKTELNELFGYDGKFEIVPLKKFLDQVNDNEGNAVNRYKIKIIVDQSIDVDRLVMNHKVRLEDDRSIPYEL